MTCPLEEQGTRLSATALLAVPQEFLLARAVQLIVIEPVAEISRAHAHGRFVEVVLLTRIHTVQLRHDK